MSCACGENSCSSDLIVNQGVDLGFRWPVFDADNEPVDLTGWTARMQARDKAGGILRAEWTTDLNGGLTFEDMNFLRLDIAAEQSAAWSWRKAQYDIHLSSPTDGPFYLAGGWIQVVPSVTT